MRVRAGTSGFSYKEWKGSFYPEKLPAAGMLRYYADRLPAVEINSTFYRMPRRSTLESWRDQTPEGFRFALKASRRITHQARLKDAGDPVGYLFQIASALGDRLGPILFQLPPFLRQDVPLLRDFLTLLPEGCRSAFEFRHASWFAEETYAALTDGRAALCGGDVDDADKSPPLVATTDWGYLRLRRSDYSEAELSAWVERIGAQPWTEVYAFFKHEERAPELASWLNAAFDGADQTGAC